MLPLLKQTVVDFFSDNAPRHGAAIAYYTLFALAPVLLLVIAVAGFVVGEDVVRSELLTQIAGLIGRDGAVAVGAMLERAGKREAGVLATVLGIGGLVFAATGAFLELQAALNMIWRVRTTDSGGIDVPQIVRRRLRSLGVVVSIGFLLLVSLSVSAGVRLAIAYMSRLAPGLEAFVAVIDQLLSVVVSSVLFGLLFRVLPDVHLRWRDVAVGSTVTAVLFAIGQWLIGLYLGNSSLASPFGAAGTVVILLVWVYYSAQIVLFGAEFTRLYAERAGKRAPLMAGAVRTAAP
ncbi:YihY/virulence factor BrkB family protein [Gemmatimonas groenlandica]|uniref:YihY/virulence factor BrkB family protein n=1 Tax=Gemmatimonas groenlandica TaxID=2732249 RepID=A0A6M4ILK9_9BACT|nr:YihY/virulence factor BrkB family protein [Gemmatimonas groenlandica]QJR34286.1 YihY/virulence factor BrkB family protein [Gemmatimonas groenlandica]